MNTEVHICPILMRTVIWEDGKCAEECNEDCPINNMDKSNIIALSDK